MNAECSMAARVSAYIALGSNIDQPQLQIKQAIQSLDALPDTAVLVDSGYFTSTPMGPGDQPDYVNAVVEIETAMTAGELLKACQSIENRQGRVKTRHWGERCIDLDILLYAEQKIAMHELTVPHPGICQRDFVFMPLLKINPEIEIPGAGMLRIIVESAFKENHGYNCRFAGDISR